MAFYKQTIEDILLGIDLAREEAEEVLSKKLRNMHWVFQRTSPVPWQSVYDWYMKQDTQEDKCVAALEALIILSECKEHLFGFLVRQKPKDPPNLSLPKQRRTP